MLITGGLILNHGDGLNPLLSELRPVDLVRLEIGSQFLDCVMPACFQHITNTPMQDRC